MHFVRAVAKLAGQSNNFRNDELSHTARVGEGRVEHGDTMGSGVLEVDLVGADAEAADDK